MKKSRLLSLLGITGFICALSSCTSSKHSTTAHSGTYAAKPVIIDGDDAEWPSPYPHYDSKAKISYAVANDKDNLYITLKASDVQIQKKLSTGGMHVWIDPTGKKEELRDINYPIKQLGMAPSDEGGQRRQHGADERPLTRDTSGHHRHTPQLATDYTLSGFNGCNGNFEIGKSNPYGLQLSMNINAYNELVWEAAIPLKSIYAGTSYGGRPVSIGFEIGGMPVRAHDAKPGGTMPSGGGMRGGGGGMGGMGGGGMHGGHGGGGNRPQAGSEDNDPDFLSHTSHTWITTGIAAQ